MIERLETYANILAVHCHYLSVPSWPGLSRHPRLKNKSWMPGRRPGTTTDGFLLDDTGDDAGTNGAAAFADGETKLFLHRDRHDQVHFHRDIVTRHHHLGAFGQMHDTGHVGGAEVELRAVVGEERGMTSALFLGEDVSLGLELGMRLHRTRLAQNLTALDFLALGSAQQRADVVAGLTLIEQLAEHLNAGDDGFLGFAKADDLDFLADLDHAALDAAGNHGAAARDREHVFHRHQERLVDRTLRLRNVLVDALHQLEDRVVTELLVLVFECRQRRTLDDRNLVAWEIILREQFADFQLDALEQFRIVHHVDLIDVHD